MARARSRILPRELTAEEVRALAASEGEPPRVSLFVPIEAGVPQVRQNAVRLRHALEQASERLRSRGGSEEELRARTAPLEGLVTDPGALPHPTRALAAFADGAGVRAYALSEREEEGAFVAASFALRPLLRALRRHLRYELLALSPKRVDLFAGNLRGLEPRPLEGVPRSLEEALGSDLEREHSRFHVRTGGGGPGTQAFGADRDERKHDLQRYHQALAQALAPQLRGRDLPLVLVADEVHGELTEELARQADREVHAVHVSPDGASEHALHERAWPLVQELAAARDREARESFERSRNHGKAAVALGEVVRAAVAGRVRRLWVEQGRRLPGRVDLGSAEWAEGPGDEELLDELAGLVLRLGGEVHVASAEAMPTDTGAAAELR